MATNTQAKKDLLIQKLDYTHVKYKGGSPTVHYFFQLLEKNLEGSLCVVLYLSLWKFYVSLWSFCGCLTDFPTRNVNSPFIQRLGSRDTGPVPRRLIANDSQTKIYDRRRVPVAGILDLHGTQL